MWRLLKVENIRELFERNDFRYVQLLNRVKSTYSLGWVRQFVQIAHRAPCAGLSVVGHQKEEPTGRLPHRDREWAEPVTGSRLVDDDPLPWIIATSDTAPRSGGL